MPCVARVVKWDSRFVKTGYSMQALSPVGRCKSFEASADGYGRGEGFNAIILQAGGLSSGAGELTLALIQGSAVNQDGRSSSLTAPNGPAQQVKTHCSTATCRALFTAHAYTSRS